MNNEEFEETKGKPPYPPGSFSADLDRFGVCMRDLKTEVLRALEDSMLFRGLRALNKFIENKGKAGKRPT